MSTTVDTNTVSDAAAWHAISPAEVVKRLATNAQEGLNPSDASARLQEYGPNRLPEGRKPGPFARFFSQLNNILIYVLLAAGFIKLMLSLWIDAAIIIGLLFFSILVHEFGHCFAARSVGGEANEVLLWPLGGLAFADAERFAEVKLGVLAGSLASALLGVVVLRLSRKPPLSAAP